MNKIYKRNYRNFDREPFDRETFDREPFDREPFDREPFDREPFDREPFDRETFDLLNIEGNKVTRVEINNPNEPFNLFNDEIDSLVNQYIPCRKLTRTEVKNRFKNWITNGIRNSMKRRDKIYKKFIKTTT